MALPRPQHIGLWTALLLISGYAFFLTLAALRSDYAVGTDGYYYVVQVQSLIQTGNLHVPDASWMLRVLAAGTWLLGDVIWGIKVTIAAFVAATVMSAYVLLTTLSQSRWVGLVGACWIAASPTIIALAAEFPKNLSSVPALFLSLAILATLTRHGASKIRVFSLVSTLIIAGTAHRLGAVLGGLACLIYVLQTPQLRRTVIAVSAVGAVLFVGLSAMLPNLLHISDWQRLSGQLAIPNGWPPPWGYHSIRPFAVPHLIELSLTASAVFVGAIAWRKTINSPLRTVLIVSTMVALFPGWRTDTLDLGFRLSLFAPILGIPLLLSYLVTKRGVAIGIIVLTLLGAPLTSKSGYDIKTDPPYDLYTQMIERIPRPLPQLLITHQGINFFYDHLTGEEAMAWAPDATSPKDTARLVYGVSEGDWLAFLDQHPQLSWPIRLTEEYWYVNRDTFDQLISWATENEDRELLELLRSWRNPSRQRPQMLVRNKKL